MPSPQFDSSSVQSSLRGSFRQRGAALAEYLPPLLFVVMLSAGAYGQYGDVLRSQIAHAADKFAENYYHGWFWPETTVAANVSWGAPGNGTQGREESGAGSSGAGGDSSGGGTPTNNTPSSDSHPGADGGSAAGSNDGSSGASGGNTGNNSSPGLSDQASNALNNLNRDPSGLGNAFTSGGTGAGGEPQQCTAGGANTTNPFSTPSSSPQSSPAPSNASTFTALGNPIDIGTGNKFQTETDYTGSGANGLTFTRYYNSVLTQNDSGVGPGWRHSYQRAIVFDSKTRTATAWRDDGTQYAFAVPDNIGLAPLGVIDHLERTEQGWLYITGDGDREQYDPAGHLQRINYASGQVHTVVYNSNGQLTQIQDARGPVITLSWRGRHLHAIELPTQQRIGYAYDDALNLRSVVRSSNAWLAGLVAGFKTPERQYHYDDRRLPHALTGLDDATGARYATWAYDAAGRGILSQHGDGAEQVRIVYHPQQANGTRSVTVTNALGLRATYTLEPARAGKYRLRDIDGQPMISCAAVQAHHRYDANGFVKMQWNADRIGSVYTRDKRGLSETEQRGVRFDANETPYSVSGTTRIERIWDKDQPWLLSETQSSWVQNKNGSGHWQPTLKREFQYDERGHVLADTVTDLGEQVIPYATKGQQRTRTYRYDFADAQKMQLKTLTVVDAGQASPSVAGAGSARAIPKNHATIYRYHNEQLQSIENPLHHTTQFSHYNSAGQAEAVQLPNGQILHIDYNEQGLPARLQRATANNTEQEITAAHYDAAGRLIHLTRPDGSEQFYGYNSAGQLTKIKNHWGETLTLTPNALTSAWESQELRNAEGDIVQRHQRRFNALGKLSAVIGNAGQQAEFDYSANGDLIKASERDQNPANETLAHTTQARYDTQHRLLALIDAAGYTTTYDYNPSGQIEAVTDANKNTTEYLRNGFGDIIQESSPTTGSVIKYYDGNGNLIENASLTGRGTTFEYDALNRLTQVDYPGEQNDIHYTYDQTDTDHGNGIQQLTKIETQSQIIDYRYDDLGRKIQETTIDKTTADKKPLSPREKGWGEGAFNTVTTTLKYHYLSGNRLDKITYPDGSEVQYHFDKDRITAVTYTAANDKSKTEKTIIKDIAYAPFGGPISWTYGNGLKQEKTLDNDGRVTDIALTKNKNQEATQWSQHYQYDLYQNIAQIQRDSDTQQFAYDKLNRLTQEQILAPTGTAVKQYGYDALSNRVSENTRGIPQHYRYGHGNQLQKSADGPVLVEAGNTLIEKNDNGTQFMLYGQRNQTRAIYKNKQLTATYGYDVRGWRNRKTTRDVKTQTPATQYFIYAQDGKLISESTGTQRKHYVWLGDAPIAQIDTAANTTQIIYLHTDHLATPRVATNDQQAIIWRWNGDAFGKGAPEQDPDKDGKITQINLRFPGQYADAETGLYYNLHRYYDPEKGRYTQSDPLGLADGANSFAYVQGNPLTGADPFGLYNAYTHFYMTYFLAITSGLPEETALKIALATQYIDENDATKPTSLSGWTNSALLKYHFTLDYDTGSHGDAGKDAQDRFYNPTSDQLNRLYGITNKNTLEKMWREAHPETPSCEPVDDEDIDDARYQFYGEYLHAYEDTFAHRDMNNMAYDKWSLNDPNTPPAIIGHIGISMPGGWEAPDQTYNSPDAVEQTCTKAGGGPRGSGSQTRHDLDAAGCSTWGGNYTPASSWKYNELRTLRMEYEIFAKLQSEFAAEIAANKENGDKAASWNDLAGTDDWDANAARIGGSAVEKKNYQGAQNTDKLQNILQQFNAAGNADKYQVLNDWLHANGYLAEDQDMPHLAITKNAGLINEDSYLKGSEYFDKAQNNRTDFLKWIPQQTSVTSGVAGGSTAPGGKQYTESEFGVILPPNTGGQMGNGTPIWSSNAVVTP